MIQALIWKLSYIWPGYMPTIPHRARLLRSSWFLKHILRRHRALATVSLRNRATGRRRLQNACVWQNWQGYYLRVLSQSSLIINVFCSFTKRSAKKGQEVWRKVFSNNYFHVCHGRFAVFLSLPSCCVSSGCHSVLGCQTCPLVKRIDPSTMFVCLCVCFFSTCDIDKVEKIRRHQWKKRH